MTQTLIDLISAFKYSVKLGTRNIRVHVIAKLFFFVPCTLCMYAGPKGPALSSWSADIGVGRPYHSPGLHSSGGS